MHCSSCFFTYFYTSISFNPTEMSKNLQQNGGFIPGIRPGKPTADYLSRISNRITLFGRDSSWPLIATIPSAILALTGNSAPFTATGILDRRLRRHGRPPSSSKRR